MTGSVNLRQATQLPHQAIDMPQVELDILRRQPSLTEVGVQALGETEVLAQLVVSGLLDKRPEDGPQEEVAIVIEPPRLRRRLTLAQETEMVEEQTASGADGREARERPSWYVPIKPIPETDHRSLTEVLLETFAYEPLELSEETQKHLADYLNQFRVPRESGPGGEAVESEVEAKMSQQPTSNGTDANAPRERPSWYIEFEPIPEDDHRTGAEVLEDTFGEEPPELSPEGAAKTLAFLNQFRVPRES